MFKSKNNTDIIHYTKRNSNSMHLNIMTQLRRILCGWSPEPNVFDCLILLQQLCYFQMLPQRSICYKQRSRVLFLLYSTMQLCKQFCNACSLVLLCCIVERIMGQQLSAFCRRFRPFSVSDSTTWFLHLLISDDNSCCKLLAIGVDCLWCGWAWSLKGIYWKCHWPQTTSRTSNETKL